MAGSFAQTCNRLSQFLKKGGSFGDISPFETAKTTETMNLLHPDEAKGRASDPETAQMTIFYAGQVIVLDGFPADKAMEIMGAAKLASSSSFTSFLGGAPLELQPQPEAAADGSSSDLPIARRASLRRFLEKRKDRVSTRAPYQMNKPAGAFRAEEGHSWIDLEAQPSKHLEQAITGSVVPFDVSGLESNQRWLVLGLE